MTVPEIMTYLESKGSESIKKILVKHGVKEPFFGVKVEFLKPIQKQVKKDYQLAKELYATGNADAQYLAGLIADDEQMTKNDLQTWAEQALSNNIGEYTVPWVATGNKHGFALALEWINSSEEYIAAIGWSTLNNWVSFVPDSELDIASLKALLNRVVETIHTSGNRVKATMNGFVISVGSYVVELNQTAMDAAKKIGAVTVDKNGTACKTPDAIEYITKTINKGALGKKKKMVKC